MAINIPLTIKHLLNNDVASFVQAYQEMADVSGLQPELAALFTTQMSELQLEHYPLLCDVTGKTSLHYAVAGNYNPDFCACFDCLIAKRDDFGMTALMLAAKFHYTAWLEYLVEDEHSQLDCYGRSALIYAISSQVPCSQILRFYQISFLFGYEWAYLDSNGRTCVDYARQFLSPESADALEEAFLRNCWAFGAPRGVRVPPRADLQLSVAGSDVQPENARIQSIFQEVQRLRKELLLQKNGGHTDDIERLQEQIQELLNENERLKTDMDNYQLRVVQLKQKAEQTEREKNAILEEMKTSQQEIDQERERLLEQYNRVNAAINESAELKSRLLEKEAKIGTLQRDNNQLQESVHRVSIENYRRSEQMMQLSSVMPTDSPVLRRASESFYRSDAMVQINVSPYRQPAVQPEVIVQQSAYPTAAQKRRMAMQDRIKQQLGRLEAVHI